MKASKEDKGTIKEIIFPLNISSEEYLKYYRGQVKWVLARSICGKKVQFPANLLSSHVTHNGIEGQFVLQYLANGKVVKLLKIAEK